MQISNVRRMQQRRRFLPQKVQNRFSKSPTATRLNQDGITISRWIFNVPVEALTS